MQIVCLHGIFYGSFNHPKAAKDGKSRAKDGKKMDERLANFEPVDRWNKEISN